MAKIGRPKKERYTIEYGKGETYRNNRPTVYKHDTYPRGSVLQFQPRRVWVEDFDTVEQAKAKYPTAEDWTPGGGSSHIPVEVMVRHLPDEDDWW